MFLAGRALRRPASLTKGLLRSSAIIRVLRPPMDAQEAGRDSHSNTAVAAATSGGARNASSSSSSTAGLLIIGDEILKGRVQDTNSLFLCQGLRQLGFDVRRILTLPDHVKEVADEIRSFSSLYDIVLTSGGIGPTHDDITFEAVAEAFEDRVEINSEIAKFVSSWFKTDDRTQPCYKLATVPTGANLHYGIDRVTGKKSLYPIISVQNVFVFPGVPQLLRKAFTNLSEDLFGHYCPGRRFHVAEFYLCEHETQFATSLNELVARFPAVTFGSYPEFGHQYFKALLTAETVEESLSAEVSSEIERVFRSLIMSYDKEPWVDAWEKLQKMLQEHGDEEFKTALKEAISTMEKCLSAYSPSEVAVAFNGGKDCVAMLHLAHAVLKKTHPEAKMQMVYIGYEDPFVEVEKFITSTEERYGLDTIRLKMPMKEALAQMIKERPEIKACVLGTRMGDPGAQHQSLFSPTDGDWPRLMRVNPVLNWRYRDIWTFIRGLSLPYPSLYDRGYTSLGGLKNTTPNPALEFKDKDGKSDYHPAYMLEDASLERNGRK